MSQSRYYFCYSSSLDSAAFDLWKQNHGYPDFSLTNGVVGRVRGYNIKFNLFSNYWGGRVLGLEPTQDAAGAEGVLFEIRSQDWPIIEHKEGLKTGLSMSLEVQVELAGGRLVQATAFSTPQSRKTDQGPVSPLFLDLIKKAYKKWGIMTDIEAFC